ncbi:hypothetical protein ACGFI9_31400 [Micromonospora sp. NPDC048930]|uniref:hypothetical protein n=1 Tax=Micromonospora sp. NPDC048930 TaxID=3364261 RepID=UPI003719FBD6
MPYIGGKVVSSYTITIAANDPSRATTTLTVELTGPTARITELVVRAGEGDGLTAGQIPAVDLDLLLKAVTPAVSGQQAITASPATPADDAPTTDDTSVDGEEPAADTEAAQPVAATTSTPDEPTTDPMQSVATEVAVPKQASRAKAPAAGTTRAGGRKTAAGAKARTAGRKATKQTAKGEAAKTEGRVYRRSPSDLESVYQQAGSVAAVADHYNVPKHTAQGWIRTLRRRQASPAE